MSESIVKQCKSCPWRTSCGPEKDIPNGYSVELHRALRRTINSGLPSLQYCAGDTRWMAYHYSEAGKEFACAGWLRNQLGVGNNLGVRMAVLVGTLPAPEVDGEQHERFEDTLPKRQRRRV